MLENTRIVGSINLFIINLVYKQKYKSKKTFCLKGIYKELLKLKFTLFFDSSTNGTISSSFNPFITTQFTYWWKKNKKKLIIVHC